MNTLLLLIISFLTGWFFTKVVQSTLETMIKKEAESESHEFKDWFYIIPTLLLIGFWWTMTGLGIVAIMYSIL